MVTDICDCLDVSYAMPLLARLVSLALPSTRANAMKIEGGLYNLGAWSIPLNVIGLLYLVFASATFSLPTVNPVTSESSELLALLNSAAELGLARWQ